MNIKEKRERFILDDEPDRIKKEYRGDILIHVGKGKNKKEIERFKDRNLKYNPGKIIAKATITDCILVDDKFIDKVYKKDQEVYKSLKIKSDKPIYAFKLENVEKIKPIEINGQLGLWNYNIEEK